MNTERIPVSAILDIDGVTINIDTGPLMKRRPEVVHKALDRAVHLTKAAIRDAYDSVVSDGLARVEKKWVLCVPVEDKEAQD